MAVSMCRNWPFRLHFAGAPAKGKRISQNQLAPSRFFQNFRCDQTHNWSLSQMPTDLWSKAHLHALHDVTGCKQWTMEEWWEQLASARTGTCMSQYDVQLQASICLQSIVILFEHRGEGTNLEFGKRCPHFTAPSCGRAVADSQNFWRLEVRTLFLIDPRQLHA